MQLDKDIQKYLIEDDSFISDALNALNANKLQIVFVVSKEKRLRGAFTDGDFRRWILLQNRIDLNSPIVQCMNTSVSYMHELDEPIDIERKLTERLRYLPIVDEQMRIVSIASREKRAISIEQFSISKTSPCFIIAEIGNNHNGDLMLAKRLVDLAIESGANCVKFQMRDMESLYVNGHTSNRESEDLGTQYILDLLSKFQLKEHEFRVLFSYCKQRNITFLCTPFDEVSADILELMGVQGFKIASADLTNHKLLKHIAKKGLPMLVSTGMSSDSEIKMAVDLLKSEAAQFVLLHCNSTYPAPFKDIQLPYLQYLSKMNDGLIGYSGHERGISVTIAAVALGAKVIEKHFTLDCSMQGNDHKVSLLPEEFSQMVKGIRQVEEAMLGNGNRNMSQGEMMNRENLAKSIVATKDIYPGQIITDDMLTVKSPGKGLPPYHLDALIGKAAIRQFKRGEFFFHSDLNTSPQIIPRQYTFSQPFGIPVRYHDANLSTMSNFDVVEYHLSYQDLNLKPVEFISANKRMKLLVHAPELFENDHTLDLASDDDNYRQISIQHLNRVFDVARALKQFYPATNKVQVIVNVGGFSQENFLTGNEISRKYALVEQSLRGLNTNNIDILIQTMPPFPWHFGGQRFHNLFVDPDESALFCQRTGTNICLDVSHSYLACNKYNLELKTYFEKLGEYIKHIHIADAAGVDDEGLKIGDGEMDFAAVFDYMKQYCNTASWIPEIWQGHKNFGEGFWQAFESLESLLTKGETLVLDN